MSSSDEAALLDAIYAKPTDDAPRRVYADWLLEQGDDYGHFINAQLKGDTFIAANHLQSAIARCRLPVAGNAVLAFQRGFLSNCLLTDEDDPMSLVDEPGWQLISTLRTRALSQEADFLAAVGPRLNALRVLELERSEGLGALRGRLARPLAQLTVRQFFDWFELDGLIDTKTWLDLNFVSVMHVRREPRRVQLGPSGRFQNVVAPVERILRSLIRPDDEVTYTYTVSGRRGREALEEVMKRIPHKSFEAIEMVAIG